MGLGCLSGMQLLGAKEKVMVVETEQSPRLWKGSMFTLAFCRRRDSPSPVGRHNRHHKAGL